MLRVIDQMVTPRQPPSSSASGFRQWSLPRVDNLMYTTLNTRHDFYILQVSENLPEESSNSLPHVLCFCLLSNGLVLVNKYLKQLKNMEKIIPNQNSFQAGYSIKILIFNLKQVYLPKIPIH